MHRSQQSLRLWFTVALFASTILPVAFAEARESVAERDIAIGELPAEARDMLRVIRAGGPFAYERDGVTFGNREHLLPAQRRGYYHEYTVATAGARNRGARRIICGGARRTPDVCYYTDDHYASFRRIRE
ncbi:MAG TPA: ribonuclease [Casimicrobiaceae bacterium]|nr:ribonuclease [Casimicrobiaceae bacterium]